MDVAYRMNIEMRNACSLLVGNPEGKSPLEKQRHEWVNNIKMTLREVGCGDTY
jgi:hypothetical protein